MLTGTAEADVASLQTSAASLTPLEAGDVASSLGLHCIQDTAWFWKHTSKTMRGVCSSLQQIQEHIRKQQKCTA